MTRFCVFMALRDGAMPKLPLSDNLTLAYDHFPGEGRPVC